MNKFGCILIVDDNEDDNYYHRLVIDELKIADSVQIAQNGLEALAYLKKENSIIPDLIFLDINMPRMNGWEFLEEYKDLPVEQKAKVVIVMLTTSINPEDKDRAQKIKEISGFETKPISAKTLTGILSKYFA